jgi:hypothetical protein
MLVVVVVLIIWAACGRDWRIVPDFPPGGKKG